MIPFAASASVTLRGRRFWRSQIVFAIFAWRAAPYSSSAPLAGKNSRAASKCVCPGMAGVRLYAVAVLQFVQVSNSMPHRTSAAKGVLDFVATYQTLAC